MVVGVETGFQKKLIVEGVGYRVAVEGSALTLNVGYSNPVNFKLPAGVSATMVDKVNTVMLESIDKELLGLTAAKVREASGTKASISSVRSANRQPRGRNYLKRSC
jgi:large subunit ribosomal protein L6